MADLADDHLVDRLVDDEAAGGEDEAALEHRAEAFDLGVAVVVVLVGRAVGESAPRTRLTIETKRSPSESTADEIIDICP